MVSLQQGSQHSLSGSDLADFFVKFLSNSNVGQLTNSHLALADLEGVDSPRCLRLAKLCMDALDFGKTGNVVIFPDELRAKKYPDFMNKPDKKVYYESKKVLGKLYRAVLSQVRMFPECSLNVP
jgi:RNA-dependent RNA polymerase